jgi:DNA polymerase (family X)
MTPTNHSLAAVFSAMADLLGNRQSKGPPTNSYRIRAYRRGAQLIASLSEDIATIAARQELQTLPGIGRDLSARIEEFLRTGTIQAYEQLKSPLPPEIQDWCRLPGLSEPVVHLLYFKLGIRTLLDLEALTRSHMLRTLPGVTISEQTLLEAIRLHRGEDNGPPFRA